MVAFEKTTFVTPQEYLQRERKAETKSEYYDGVIVAMSGASWEHNLITAELTRLIGNGLEGKSCVVTASDLRVGVAQCNRYCYPDLTVVCGKPEFEDEAFDTLLNPTLIVEVLSPSTEAMDRGEKFDCLKTLPSLQTYVLVAQDKPCVETFTRQADGTWSHEIKTGLDAIMALPAINCELRLAEIYARIDFADALPQTENPPLN